MKEITLQAANQSAFDFMRSLPFDIEAIVSKGIVSIEEIVKAFHKEVYRSVHGTELIDDNTKKDANEEAGSNAKHFTNNTNWM